MSWTMERREEPGDDGFLLDLSCLFCPEVALRVARTVKAGHALASIADPHGRQRLRLTVA